MYLKTERKYNLQTESWPLGEFTVEMKLKVDFFSILKMTQDLGLTVKNPLDFTAEDSTF